MQALLLAALFATLTSGGPGGRLYVRVMPGVQVFVDGVPAGVSNAEESGKLVQGVAPGPHRVVIRTTDGREASVNVAISEGLTTEVNISPLGFRKLNRPPDDDESAMLRVTGIPTDSLVEFHGVTRQNHDGSELTFDAIPAGSYPLVVTVGGRAIRAQIDVPKGSIITVAVDEKASAMRTIETKARPRRLQINDPNDALRMLNIPNHWKTAIRSVLPNTVSLLDASSQGNSVQVRLKVPSPQMAVALVGSLERSSAFSRVTLSGSRRDQSGWTADFIFTFADGR